MADIEHRDPAIDILRGISILIVLVGHFHIGYRLWPKTGNGFGPILTSLVLENEHYAVISFFSISGFLITSNIIRRNGTLGTVDLRQFYLYRFARIVPCLILFVIMIAILQECGIVFFQLGSEEVPDHLSVLSAFFSFQNVLLVKHGWFSYCMNILWSISIEEAFYLMMPLMCLMLKKNYLIIISWLVLIIVGPIYRAASTDSLMQHYSYLSCFDAIGYGCCAAILGDRARRETWNLPVMPLRLVGVVFLLGASLAQRQISVTCGVSIIAFGTALILITSSRVTGNEYSGEAGSVKWITWFGRHSYELYLFHIIVLAGMRSFAGSGIITPVWRPIWFVIFIAGSMLLATIVTRYYSEPANVVLRRAFQRYPPAATAVS
ncbi:MAG: hypothetical protein QOD11_933 [Bradyrhizobium sp.]|jgi:peptidoglycan/LPS O-acetylase OafA/YrhL|nr:hypothetical protein [Bradyrhizobium sp.]